jgi:hypothetical protein
MRIMIYSKRHKRFASDLKNYHNINEQDVLKHPENYLGPNYKELLNYWFYWDSLSDVQTHVYFKRINSLDTISRYNSQSIAIGLAKEVIDHRFVNFLFIIEIELIAAHLYIERFIIFTRIPLLFKDNFLIEKIKF